jgi:hypothetical protein
MRGRLAVLFLVCGLWGVALPLQAQTTQFSFQGRLTDGASPAHGTYDLQFALYDTLAGGSQIGVTTAISNVTVGNGVFTVLLDFGAPAFPGAERFLEIAVKKPADATYTTLSPRQPVVSAPYAVRALSAASVEPAAAGNSIVAAINNDATSVTINDSRLATNLLRLKPAAQQVSASGDLNGADALLNLRGTYGAVPSGPGDFKVLHNGGFLATGFVRDVGNTTGCASSIPATGAGTRFMWHPCRGSLRFGRVPTGQTNWDDANMDDFTFAGGNQVTASGYGAFAYGDQVTVDSTVGVGFGSGVVVTGTAGFSAGASNLCSGFACTAIGYTNAAGGQGSVALGYRTLALGDYSVALGYRTASCTGGTISGTSCSGGTIRTGTFLWGDESTTTYMQSQADNEFRVRANGGVRFRVSTAASGNTPGAGGNIGCDLTVAVPSWTCASSRDVKENFATVDASRLLSGLRALPVSTFNYIDDTTRTRHLGPMAEDFFDAFQLGDSNKSINTANLAGVSLAAAKALEARTAELQKTADALEARLKQQQASIDALTKALCAVAPATDVCR